MLAVPRIVDLDSSTSELMCKINAVEAFLKPSCTEEPCQKSLVCALTMVYKLLALGPDYDFAKVL